MHSEETLHDVLLNAIILHHADCFSLTLPGFLPQGVLP